MTRQRWMVLATALWMVAVPFRAAAQGGADKKEKPAALMEPEKGKYRVMVGTERVGGEDFQLTQGGAEWNARSEVKLSLPGGGAVEVSGALRLNAEGKPVRYEWSVKGERKASGSVDFQGGTATVELRIEGQPPFTQQYFFETNRVVILDNNVYFHYAVLARLYDWSKRGPQTFSVLIPQDMMPGTVTVESLGAQDTPTGKLELLKVRSTDLEIDLYVQGRKLVRLAVPASNVIVEYD